jgi:hypothetical protein
MQGTSTAYGCVTHLAIQAVGRLTDAMEMVIRARGYLCGFD